MLAFSLLAATPAPAQDVLVNILDDPQLPFQLSSTVRDAFLDVGSTGVQVVPTVPEGDLDAYKVVILVAGSFESPPRFDADQFRDFLGSGGWLMLVGDSFIFTPQHNDEFNRLLGELGSDLRLVDIPGDSGCGQPGTVVDPGGHPLTVDVTSFSYALQSGIELGQGGIGLVEGLDGSPLVAVQNRIVVVTDANTIVQGCPIDDGNLKLVQNLYEAVDLCGDQDDDGFVSTDCFGRDCNDLDGTISPGADEVWYDGIDQNCDDASDFDQDGDGQDSDEFGGEDCDDLDPRIFAGAPDPAYDGIDSDCRGNDDFDRDGDGFDGVDGGGDDCNDIDPEINPGAAEIADDGIDQDCDGADLVTPPPAPVVSESEGCGCASSPAPAGGVLGLALLGFVAGRRRR